MYTVCSESQIEDNVMRKITLIILTLFSGYAMALAVLTIAIATALPAMAKENNKHYIGIDGGLFFNTSDAINKTIPPSNNIGNTFDLKNNTSSGFYSIKYGYYVTNSVRAELSVSKYGKTHDSYYSDRIKQSAEWEYDSTVVFANLYYDFDFGEYFKPFVIAGFGLSHNSIGSNWKSESSSVNINRSKNNFAWQIGTGGNLSLTENWTLNTFIKYTNKGTFQIKETIKEANFDHKMTLSTIDIGFGLNYTF